MALALTRNLMMLRSAPALRASRHNARRALAVRAFKDEKRHQHKQSAAQQPQQEEQPAPAPTPTDTSVAPSPQVSAPLPLEAVPFRRMTDAMAQMQREMDSLMSQFGFNDPFFSASPFRAGARAGSALSPFALLDSAMAPPALPSLVPPSPSGLARAMGPLSRMVPVEVAEDDTSVTITAEVPGFAKEDIKVTVDPTRNLLTISGEKATGAGPKEAEGKEPAEGATSRSFMTFTRSFTLPPDVDVDKDIKATAEHGVLKVVLPKAHQHEPASAERQIPVA